MSKQCQSCMPSPEGYAVRFLGERNVTALHEWIAGDKFTHYDKIDDNTIWVHEQTAADLLDYFNAHMELEQIQVAPCQNGEFSSDAELEWLPFADVKKRYDAHWIDGVIAEQRIRTAYQPIVSVQNGETEVQAYEFLSRAVGSEGEIIPPFQMFEAARARNRLFALDRVCRIQAVRNADQVTDKMVFVNFIPTAIYTPEHCLQTTLAEARATGVDPSMIVFEVVESEEVDSIDHLENILLYYRKHGFRYALDDVGAGFSTIEKVERLKPDFVKLDMHYVQGVAHDADKQKIALTLVESARRVGARTLAEGVETEEDWKWLIEAGYELFQGYFFGRPEFEPREVKMSLTS